MGSGAPGDYFVSGAGFSGYPLLRPELKADDETDSSRVDGGVCDRDSLPAPLQARDGEMGAAATRLVGRSAE